MLVALNDNVILKLEKPDETKPGSKLVIPELARQESNIGVVVSCNILKKDEAGNLLKPLYGIGTRVVFRPHSAIKINHDGEDFLIVPENAIVARVE